MSDDGLKEVVSNGGGEHSWLPKSMTTITPFSKSLSFILFLITPFLGFYIGIKYQQIISPKININPEIKIVKIPVTQEIKAPETDKGDLVYRCGDIPDVVLNKMYGQMSGPAWSPDCRHIAWGAWESGPMGVRYAGPISTEGLFIYDDRTKSIRREYKPQAGDTVLFEEWKDSNTVEFSKRGTGSLFDIDITTGEIVPRT